MKVSERLASSNTRSNAIWKALTVQNFSPLLTVICRGLDGADPEFKFAWRLSASILEMTSWKVWPIGLDWTGWLPLPDWMMLRSACSKRSADCQFVFHTSLNFTTAKTHQSRRISQQDSQTPVEIHRISFGNTPQRSRQNLPSDSYAHTI